VKEVKKKSGKGRDVEEGSDDDDDDEPKAASGPAGDNAEMEQFFRRGHAAHQPRPRQRWPHSEYGRHAPARLLAHLPVPMPLCGAFAPQ
jgi:hypothetical protein